MDSSRQQKTGAAPAYRQATPQPFTGFVLFLLRNFLGSAKASQHAADPTLPYSMGQSKSLTFSAHPCRIPRSFATLPESPSLRPGQCRVTNAAVFRSIVLFARA